MPKAAVNNLHSGVFFAHWVIKNSVSETETLLKDKLIISWRTAVHGELP